MKHSDYSLIPTFVAIVEEKSYTKAAQRLGVSQSAVSQAVVRLREVFKDALFIRESHGVAPTAFAIDIYPTLATAVESIAYMLPEHSRFNPAECDKRFVISSLSVFSFTLLPELSALLNEKAPKANTRIEPLFTMDLTSLLRSQQCDLVIEAQTNLHPHLRSQILMSDKLTVVCREEHPRLQGNTISVEEYLNEKHVTLSQFDQQNGYLIGRGIKNEQILGKRQVAWQAGSIIEILPVVQRCDYLALMPQTLLEQYRDLYHLRELEAEFMKDPIDVAMYWHPSRTNDPSHQWLREQCLLAAEKFVINHSI
ncbi:Bacterial regulatory helix-turn-helix, lysR family protein [Vibrio owensii]|uniref:LysR family transcriptional regulator n=1 Tax=Vibrio owensii TaxID=696485 RepID=UPI00221F97D9|nr:LysR family transcriptional regulator [Vibrio owensii]CAH1578134.1 Bacterial regulatory helix-turn-helix, lysR family protein [Vibrio owensii]